jgi:hypothetical protein
MPLEEEKSVDLEKILDRFSYFQEESEKNTKIIGESVLGLKKYWEQMHWYYALVGSLITSICMGGLFFYFYYYSSDRLLSQVGVHLRLESEKSKKRLILYGKKIVNSGQADEKVMVEFE